MHSIHIRIPEDLYEAMRDEAYGGRRSLNSITVDALNDARQKAFVPDKEKKLGVKRITVWVDDEDGVKAVDQALHDLDASLDYQIEGA